MARCDKCLMDPCLCDLDGFGPEEEEDTTSKDIAEIMGKRCILKTTWEGDKLFLKYLGKDGFNIGDRATDVTGIIKELNAIIDPTAPRTNQGLLELDPDHPEALTPIPIFYIEYDEPFNGKPGHWYLDDEVIYL